MHRARDTFRRLRRVSSASTVVLLALMTAAYAAVGDVPLKDGSEPQTSAIATVGGGSGFQMSSVSGVTWTADNMVPGDARLSQITVTNSGTTAGDFTLRAHDLVDVPAAPAQTLSSALQVRVQDITSVASPVTLYDGSLSVIATIGLGRWQPGEAHVYRFTSTFPLGRPDALDNELQEATAAIQYSWDGLMDDESKPD